MALEQERRNGRIALLGDGIRAEGSIYFSEKFRAVGDVQLISYGVFQRPVV